MSILKSGSGGFAEVDNLEHIGWRSTRSKDEVIAGFAAQVRLFPKCYAGHQYIYI